MVVIRLARYGKHKAPFYRIVVADHEMKRDGRHLEVVGSYNPKVNPAGVTLEQDRVKYWVSVGAKPSDTVSQLIGREMPGYLNEIEEGRLTKVRSRRAKRKAEQKKAAPKK